MLLMIMPKPIIDKKKCNDCGLCVQACPVGVFTKKSATEVANPSECIGCRACEAQCPKAAIKVVD